ncbi:hypothetical protein XA3_18970 [Xylocopilactobacillus apicola]|uniref:Uncharacterized protein n=1 Tax=Xylocopilactobacillus apicola TaxID=2932184 RepID=A0AAU9DAI2_9LACO|nr:hypothetical protein XA3_18970 [Xylocopilactobacillus apicola]
MNLKKYFNLTFEESDKITHKLAMEEASIVKREGISKKHFFKAFIGTLILDLVLMFLCGSMVIAMPDVTRPVKIVLFAVLILTLSKILIFGVVFWIKSSTNDRLVYDYIVYASLFFTFLFIAISAITSLVVIGGKLSIGNTNVIFINAIYISFSIYSAIYSIVQIKNDAKKYFDVKQTTNPVLEQFLKYSGFILTTILGLKFIIELFLGGNNFFENLKKTTVVFIMIPLAIFFEFYYLIYIFFMRVIIPYYYLKKYRKQYEEKYQFSFKGAKKVNKQQEILPLGTVLFLEEGTQKVMIVGRGVEFSDEGEDKFMDYMGCLYPVGVDPERTIFFNHEDIDHVVFEGFKDEEESRFHQVYNEWLKNLKVEKKKL